MPINKVITGFEFKDSPTASIWTPGVNLTKLGAYGIDNELNQFMNGLKPEKNASYVLVNAMGAGDYYNCNRNGDYFSEKELLESYKTFLSGHVFTKHVNKDPAKARGTIPFAAWNKNMKRVELVFRLPHDDKNEQLLSNLEKGLYFDVSMGTRVAFDRCSRCGNEAKTKAQYCEHVKNDLHKILPDGRCTHMENVGCKFFDCSVVDRGADRTAKALAKLASFQEFTGHHYSYDPIIINSMSDDQIEKFAELSLEYPPSVAAAEAILEQKTATPKSANIRKASDITKKIPMGTISRDSVKTLPELYDHFAKVAMPMLREAEPIILPDVLDDYAEKGAAAELLSTLAMSGVILKPSEFQVIMLNKESAYRLMDEGVSFLDFEPIKVAHDKGFDRVLSVNKYDAGIAKKLAHVIEKKSYFRGGLLARAFGTENSDVAGIYPASHFLIDDPFTKTAEVNLEEVPADVKEVLGKVAGLFESYIEVAQKLAIAVIDGDVRIGKTAELQPPTFRDAGHVEKACPIGLPGLIFGMGATKLAVEMQETLYESFDKDASFKMAEHAMESGAVFTQNDMHPLLVDICIIKGVLNEQQ